MSIDIIRTGSKNTQAEILWLSQTYIPTGDLSTCLLDCFIKCNEEKFSLLYFFMPFKEISNIRCGIIPNMNFIPEELEDKLEYNQEEVNRLERKHLNYIDLDGQQKNFIYRVKSFMYWSIDKEDGEILTIFFPDPLVKDEVVFFSVVYDCDDIFRQTNNDRCNIELLYYPYSKSKLSSLKHTVCIQQISVNIIFPHNFKCIETVYPEFSIFGELSGYCELPSPNGFENPQSRSMNFKDKATYGSWHVFSKSNIPALKPGSKLSLKCSYKEHKYDDVQSENNQSTQTKISHIQVLTFNDAFISDFEKNINKDRDLRYEWFVYTSHLSGIGMTSDFVTEKELNEKYLEKRDLFDIFVFHHDVTIKTYQNMGPQFINIETDPIITNLLIFLLKYKDISIPYMRLYHKAWKESWNYLKDADQYIEIIDYLKNAISQLRSLYKEVNSFKIPRARDQKYVLHGKFKPCLILDQYDNQLYTL